MLVYGESDWKINKFAYLLVPGDIEKKNQQIFVILREVVYVYVWGFMRVCVKFSIGSIW